METRRFILALSLSLLVFLLYVRFFAPKPPLKPVVPAPAEVHDASTSPAPQVAAEQTKPVIVHIPATAKGKDIVIETDLLKAVLNTAGGTIKSWELKKYREADKTPVGLGVLWKKIVGVKQIEKPKKELGNVQLLSLTEDTVQRELVFPLTITPLAKGLEKISGVVYTADRDSLRLSAENPSQTVLLTYTGPGSIRIEKRITFYNDDYKVEIVVNTSNIDGYNIALGTDFGFADKVSSDASGRVGMVARLDGKTITEKLESIKGEMQHAGFLEWFSQGDKYFTASLVYTGQGIITSRKTAAPAETGDLLNTELLVKEKPETRTFLLYAGPKAYTRLEALGHGLEQMVDYGWFGILAKPMFWLLRQFYSITSNYGIAIILLTIVVRILLFYPSLKSATAMEEMKSLQPQMNALREKYKKDPARMNQEIMKLYKDHKVNPLGGCLPMLLQLPFFVALYNVLSVSIELRQASFISFWIKDLSVFDPFYILPVLMGVSMILTMKMTSTTADPQQAKIMMFMNVAFIFLFAWLPAGLLLYITLSNVLSIVQQLYVRKIISTAKA